MSADIRQDNNTSRTPVSQKGKQIKAADGTADFIGGQVSVTIDGHALKVPLGTTILDAAKKLGIKIPTLCHHPDLCVAGVCRVCVVEVENQRNLQASCAYPITAPLKVHTHTKKVRQARRHVLDLLLSEHYGECYSCVRNNNCELQALANEHGVDFYRFGHVKESRFPIDASSYSVVRDMDKCVLCRRCVRTCIDVQEVGALEAAGRGPTTHISTYLEKPLGDVVCINCGQCINRCPTGALHAKDASDEVWRAIDDPKKHVVIQTAPSPRAGIGECFGLEPGTPMTYQMNTALRLAGFDKVFDTNFSADLTIIEEGTELLLRLHKALVKKEPVAFPQFSSCSPGWVKYLEHFYPEYIPNLSSAKSPQQMFGAVIKTYYAQQNHIDPKDIVTVALMPCSAKKFECNRPEMDDSGFKDVDYGLTTRELAQMIKEVGIHLPDMPKGDFDEPFGTATGSGRHLRRDRRRHGGGPADGDRAGNRPEGREPVRERQHRPGARLRRRAVRGAAAAGGEPDGGAHSPGTDPQLGLPEGSHAEGGGGARDGERQEGHGGHQGGRPVRAVPPHRVHGLPRRLHRRRRPADPDIARDPQGAGAGDLRRRRGVRGPQVAREPGRPQALHGVPDRWSVRAPEPQAPAHALHAEGEVHRVGRGQGPGAEGWGPARTSAGSRCVHVVPGVPKVPQVREVLVLKVPGCWCRWHLRHLQHDASRFAL